MDQDKKNQLKRKLNAKINEKRIKRGAQPIIMCDVSSDDALILTVESLCHDVKLPQITRITNILEKTKILEKKYKPFRDKYQRLYVDIIQGEFDLERDMPMFKQLLATRKSVNRKETTIEDADERLKEQLYESHKIVDEEQKN